MSANSLIDKDLQKIGVSKLGIIVEGVGVVKLVSRGSWRYCGAQESAYGNRPSHEAVLPQGVSFLPGHKSRILEPGNSKFRGVFNATAIYYPAQVHELPFDSSEG